MCGNKNNVYICTPETMISVARCEAFARRAVGKSRRDAGVVDRAALEMRCTGNCTGGSNPSLSAEALPAERRKPANEPFAGFFVRYGRSMSQGRVFACGRIDRVLYLLLRGPCGRIKGGDVCTFAKDCLLLGRQSGEVLEWLKRRAWKARIRLKRIRGSNPLLSANSLPMRREPLQESLRGFLFFAVRIFERFFEWPPAGFRVPRLRLSIPRRPVFVARVGGAFYSIRYEKRTNPKIRPQESFRADKGTRTPTP